MVAQPGAEHIILHNTHQISIISNIMACSPWWLRYIDPQIKFLVYTRGFKWNRTIILTLEESCFSFKLWNPVCCSASELTENILYLYYIKFSCGRRTWTFEAYAVAYETTQIPTSDIPHCCIFVLWFRWDSNS